MRRETIINPHLTTETKTLTACADCITVAAAVRQLNESLAAAGGPLVPEPLIAQATGTCDGIAPLCGQHGYARSVEHDQFLAATTGGEWS